MRNWKAVFEDNGGYDALSSAYEIRDDDGNLIATLDVMNYQGIDNLNDDHGESPTAKTNAQKIAATNDMYEALKAFIEHRVNMGEAYVMANKALAKAEGRVAPKTD